MIEIKITAQELANAICQLASALTERTSANANKTFENANKTFENANKTFENANKTDATHVNHATVATVAPVANPAPAVTPTPAPVAMPTAAPTITMDMVARAGASLVDAGKTPQLMEILRKHGAEAVTQLKPEQLASVASELRSLGASI